MEVRWLGGAFGWWLGDDADDVGDDDDGDDDAPRPYGRLRLRRDSDGNASTTTAGDSSGTDHEIHDVSSLDEWLLRRTQQRQQKRVRRLRRRRRTVQGPVAPSSPPEGPSTPPAGPDGDMAGSGASPPPVHLPPAWSSGAGEPCELASSRESSEARQQAAREALGPRVEVLRAEVSVLRSSARRLRAMLRGAESAARRVTRRARAYAAELRDTRTLDTLINRLRCDRDGDGDSGIRPRRTLVYEYQPPPKIPQQQVVIV